MSTHTPGPVAWQKFGEEYYLTGQYGMRPIILSVGRRDSRPRPIRSSESTIKLLTNGLLVDFTPEHPDAKFIVKAWNCHDDLLAACKAIEERFSKDCLLHETNPLVLKLRAAIAKAEGAQ